MTAHMGQQMYFMMCTLCQSLTALRASESAEASQSSVRRLSSPASGMGAWKV